MGSFPEKLIRLAQEQKLGTRGLHVLLEHIPVPSIIILRSYNYSFCKFLSHQICSSGPGCSNVG